MGLFFWWILRPLIWSARDVQYKMTLRWALLCRSKLIHGLLKAWRSTFWPRNRRCNVNMHATQNFRLATHLEFIYFNYKKKYRVISSWSSRARQNQNPTYALTFSFCPYRKKLSYNLLQGFKSDRSTIRELQLQLPFHDHLLTECALFCRFYLKQVTGSFPKLWHAATTACREECFLFYSNFFHWGPPKKMGRKSRKLLH